MSNVTYFEEEVQDVAIYEDGVWSEYPISIRVTATTGILITAIIGLGGRSNIYPFMIWLVFVKKGISFTRLVLEVVAVNMAMRKDYNV